jgi:hypothetical protein
VVDPALTDSIRVTLIAAGMEELHTVRIQAVRPDTQPQVQPQTPPVGRPRPSTPVHPAPMDNPRRSGPQTPGAPSSPGQSPSRPVGQQPASQMPARPPQATPPSGRQQRSLNDLRGIRSMGRRQEAIRGNQEPQIDEDNTDAIDVPPFLKRYD